MQRFRRTSNVVEGGDEFCTEIEILLPTLESLLKASVEEAHNIHFKKWKPGAPITDLVTD